MKKIILLAVIVVAAQFVTGCAAKAKSPVTGFLFTDVRGPEAVGSGGEASKFGEACATSILGWVATGDASIEAARKSGGITEISFVDYHSTIVLGIFAKYCVKVSGR
ncbi:MAG: TRL-like family protein [Nitrospinota bacterium]|nr:TRL-like family protein [Nitrospinota bacterium]